MAEECRSLTCGREDDNPQQVVSQTQPSATHAEKMSPATPAPTNTTDHKTPTTLTNHSRRLALVSAGRIGGGGQKRALRTGDHERIVPTVHVRLDDDR